MVLSKFPIVDYQVVLLPRQMDDKRYLYHILFNIFLLNCLLCMWLPIDCNEHAMLYLSCALLFLVINTNVFYDSDDHQRVILNVKVSIPETHVTSQSGACSASERPEPVTMDVMTSHFRYTLEFMLFLALTCRAIYMLSIFFISTLFNNSKYILSTNFIFMHKISSLNEQARNQGVRTLVQEITRTDNPKYKHSPVQVIYEFNFFVFYVLT